MSFEFVDFNEQYDINIDNKSNKSESNIHVLMDTEFEDSSNILEDYIVDDETPKTDNSQNYFSQVKQKMSELIKPIDTHHVIIKSMSSSSSEQEKNKALIIKIKALQNKYPKLNNNLMNENDSYEKLLEIYNKMRLDSILLNAGVSVQSQNNEKSIYDKFQKLKEDIKNEFNNSHSETPEWSDKITILEIMKLELSMIIDEFKSTKELNLQNNFDDEKKTELGIFTCDVEYDSFYNYHEHIDQPDYYGASLPFVGSYGPLAGIPCSLYPENCIPSGHANMSKIKHQMHITFSENLKKQMEMDDVD